MPRRTPPDRLEKLIAAAAEAFVEHGFQRTQMDDIAERLGVSKGTVYRSVDSKESLFAAVLEHGDTPNTLPEGGLLESVGLAELASTVRIQLGAAIPRLELTKATAAPSPANIGDEIEHIVGDLYSMMAHNRVRVMVLDRCAVEVPELTGDWYHAGRYTLVDLWSSYLDRRAGQIPSSIDRDVLARTIVETITLWAIKMPWDPSPRPYAPDQSAACSAMIRNLIIGEPQ